MSLRRFFPSAIEWVPLPHENGGSQAWDKFQDACPSKDESVWPKSKEALQDLVGELYEHEGSGRVHGQIVAADLSVLHLPEGMRSFEEDVIPEMIRAVHALPTLFPLPEHNLPTLGPDSTVQLSYRQVSALLSAAVLELVPAEWFSLDFVLQFAKAKTLGILQYLTVALGRSLDPGMVTFVRRSIGASDVPDWSALEVAMSSVPVVVQAEAPIEAMVGELQADFANEYLGGGVLGGGQVQEEIRLGVTNPQLLIGVLISPAPMGPNEAILMAGSEQFSAYKGYGRLLRWGGRVVDTSERDEATGSFLTRVVAFDALPFRFTDEWDQFSKAGIERELTKAYAAFSRWSVGDYEAGLAPIATGNWGCGAFGGDKPLKVCIQWLAAAAAGRPVTYCTFGDAEIGRGIERLAEVFGSSGGGGSASVAQVYEWVVSYAAAGTGYDTVIDFVVAQARQ